MLFAVVDIETTGGHADASSITEIAICIHDGVQVIERFESLVRPQHVIPPYIVALTGISNEMVQQAPEFSELAKPIYELLEGRIFVAHNVQFDYSFVQRQLQKAGHNWSARRLCTLRLARQYFPGYPSYSLGKLANSLAIDMQGKHRAGFDADATAIILGKLITHAGYEELLKTSQQKRSEFLLPPHLSWTEYNQLPELPGVYYLKNAKGQPVYIGKAKNIKKRVKQHFLSSGAERKRQALLKEVHYIEATRCGTELMALILEAAEIKKYWPESNRALKYPEERYDLLSYEDMRGYQRLAVNKHRPHQDAIVRFGDLGSAYTFLDHFVREYELCPKLSMIYKKEGACGHDFCSGACVMEESPERYNRRVSEALKDYNSKRVNFAFLDAGLEEDQQSCILVENGELFGVGYVQRIEYDSSYRYLLRKNLTRLNSSRYVMSLINRYASLYPEKVISFDK